ncbi:MAG: DNA primase [candidate division Zixibacteria bacterium]|nr:DNA primase [candidate division Zixibacteria bacterium]
MMTGFIPENIVEKIKSDTDILDLINEYVSLKRAGKDFLGLCPFHREKTPSFTVVPAKDFFYCFGCGASGNAASFIMRHENLDYPEALRFLAKRAGIAIPKTGSPDSLSSRLYQAIEYAHNLYIKNLKNSSAYDYIKARGISDDIIKELEIGYAPPGWENLYRASVKDKFPPDLFDKAGLIVKSEKRQGYYDKFRNRLMFPIKNISGRVIGFGGRALGDDEGPKYLNSPETNIYHKGSVLYGLNWSKNHIRAAEKVIITEGYFDYISLYQAGIKNIVAVSGTGLTANQAALMARFCKEAILLYDADSAGLKATFRAVDVLYNAGLEPYVVRLPKGSDPDSFIKQSGADELITSIASAVTYLDFVKSSLPDKFIKLPISRQEKIINSLVETAAGIYDGLKHELFVRKATETLDLPNSVAVKFQRTKTASAAGKTTEILSRINHEIDFFSFIIANTIYIKDSLRVIKPEYFKEPKIKEAFNKLDTVKYEKLFAADLLELLPDNGIRRKISEKFIRLTTDGNTEARFSEFVAAFNKFHKSDRLADIRAAMAEAEKRGEQKELDKLTREYLDLSNVAKPKGGLNAG